MKFWGVYKECFVSVKEFSEPRLINILYSLKQGFARPSGHGLRAERGGARPRAERKTLAGGFERPCENYQKHLPDKLDYSDLRIASCDSFQVRIDSQSTLRILSMYPEKIMDNISARFGFLSPALDLASARSSS